MTILVTGATGNVGRLVVDCLLAAGAKQIRALTNNPKKAALPAEGENMHMIRTQGLARSLDIKR